MQLAPCSKSFRLVSVLLLACLSAGSVTAQQVQFPQDQNVYPPQGNPGTYQTTPRNQPSVPEGIVLPGDDSRYHNLQAGPGQEGLTPLELQQLQLQLQLQRTPYPPTDFQNLVRTTLGRSLKIYGGDLFLNAPTTFAPVDHVPVTQDYTIGPGDEILLQAWGQVTLNSHYVVDRLGNIYVPQVGTIHVAGVQFAQLQDYIKTQMSRTLRNFDLNANLGQLRSIQIFVVGQARRPGNYTVSSLSTLVNALFATGGPTPQGSMRHIQVKRADKVVTEFDLYDLLLRGDKSKDVPLLPGDVIYIPPVGPQVAVAGSVKNQAIYELNPGSTVADALQAAGDTTAVALTHTLRIERVADHQTRAVVEVPWTDAGKATPMQDGDILELNSISDQFKDAVTLRGNVANPGRYEWHPGMRVKELIPSQDSLVTRDYWKRRAQLGEPTINYAPIPELGNQLEQNGPYGQNGQYRQNGYGQNGQYRQQQNGANNQYNGTYQGQQQTDQQSNGQVQNPNSGLGSGLLAGSLSDSSSATLNSAQNSPNNIQSGVPGGAQNGGSDSTANRSAVAAETSVTRSGTFGARNDIVLSGPDIDWSYAVIERRDKKTLTTSLIPFNLGSLVLNGEATQNLELLPEDVVTIFSKADLQVPQSQQTRYVRLEGEFVSSGIYSVQPGETLRQLVERAGGLTADAYLYGAEFTRESTRRLQQQHLNEYANQLEREASIAAVGSTSAVSAQDASANAASQLGSQTLVARLRQVRASGRVVLKLPVDSQGVSALPEMQLEDGDHFVVPRVPMTVEVEGAVYSPNAFLFSHGQRVGGYLKMAGGANRDADTKRAFVIRADGSVVSKQYSSALRGGSFESVMMNPGDTLVVPVNLHRGQTLRTVADIATIVGQFGIFIAALNTVF
jgi:protein involved in polysaccharide export with SLBB domain